MENIKQFGIITAVFFVGEVLNMVIPLPVPGSVWGMIIMFILLCTKVVKLEHVEKAADFLLAIMAFLFVPLGVGLMTSFDAIKNDIGAIVIVILVSTVAVMVVTGIVVEQMRKKDKAVIGEEAVEKEEVKINE
ncbi:holin-like protein [Clostridium collagenovorans DSM 3089]|uniref:Holin-like protein n=1 Tax=Clostridium collagenovorans DSM 3089 TaxID=1121306 RepID=A0A1M5XIE3_9CLOT|nr:CidA/LrgA family protein [Clostridium collagenovorans]SHH99402.1 holin-like protein [Clostridium collagenovorans DSM 3089]